MCGRYTLSVPAETLAQHFGLETVPDVAPRFNIAPTQAAPVVRLSVEREAPVLDFLRWGLVPSWAKDASAAGRLINARSETAAEKPSFRSAMRHRRCLVPADGFYEWRAEGGAKQPYRIARPDGAPIAFAGLWERWGKGDEPLETFTILTTAANATLAPLHDRMPVILDPADYALWLDPTASDVALVEPLLRAAPEGALTYYAVSRAVNRVGHDDASLVVAL
ncbi:MAG: SOS response-associated peptidase [Ardenticatenales bacterium]